MDVFKKLEPRHVWDIFGQITQVPRPSKKEEKIIAWLLDFAKKNKLSAKKDEAGNVLITKPATKGMEKVKTVVLQSHIDMVCEKNSDVKIDFEKDPIQPVIDGEWVKAKGTTLGADDGIGMAAALALLIDNKIKHGPLEALFTVDEETGLTGAFALKPGFITGKTLINLDSEDEGEIFIGCAGGKDTVATFKYETKKVPKQHVAYKISISGLKGGHSGDDIHRGLANSNKLINRFLWNASWDLDIRLSHIDGGNLRNAIPREASAVFVLSTENEKLLKKYFNFFAKEIKSEWAVTEPELTAKLAKTELPAGVIDKYTHFSLLNALYACPHGVIAMSQDMPGMVETSTNLASVKMADKSKIVVTTSQRSSVESAKNDIVSMVSSVFLLAGAKVKSGEGYPGWKPNVNSELLKISRESYKRLFKKEPVVRAIHAGLECGLFLEKYPELDMISIGPTLRGVHSPVERIEIKTVQLFWDHLVDILNHIPKEK
ncbi:MAG: cytosol nonspecific dipeptidase [Bacteroidetes bacterium HGW-Bacteroidetes-21]|jgi:dipeptidase D|nr:MAG: cytosol nonspecific dipeptidase [Bacteroidetes bacterium HGW-Bacteroidetes-21]